MCTASFSFIYFATIALLILLRLTLADVRAAEGMYRMSVKDRESVCMSVWAAGSPPVDVLPLFRAHAVTP